MREIPSPLLQEKLNKLVEQGVLSSFLFHSFIAHEKKRVRGND